MSVRRDGAIINEQLDLRFELRYDRTGSLFDADSVTKVEIIDTDSGTILETILTANITKIATGTYKVITSASWNTSSRSITDKWYFVIDGVENILSASTFIRSTSSPTTGMASYVSLVKLKVQDKKGILSDPSDYEEHIKDAVKEYSRRKPYIEAVKLEGTGNTYFNITDSLNNWENDFSWIFKIEYPLSQVPPQYLNDNAYEVTRMDDGDIWCRFREYIVPNDSEEFTVRFAKRNTIDDSGTTVPESDKNAVCCLAAAKCLRSIADYYLNTNDPTVDADVVSYRTRGDEASSRADKLEAEYNRQIRQRFTGKVIEQDMDAFWNYGESFMFHDRDIF